MEPAHTTLNTPRFQPRRCLDLFAGSDILGFEALSRGAAGLVQVERGARVSGQLELSAAAVNRRATALTAVTTSVIVQN
ncbi:MAG: RsmD family RNA methyltransferase [Pseudohongiellaceae bacterium]